MSQSSRRAFLRHAATYSSMGVAAPLGLNLSAITQAAAQSSGTSGYRAIVCLFMNGGNDAFNTVLPTDTTSWGHYVSQRNPTNSNDGIGLPALGVAGVPGASSVRERLGGVIPIATGSRPSNSGRQFALHPALTQVQALHQAGRLAVLANVGPLLRPTIKSDMSNAAVTKPAKLFSHNDQSSTWQSFKPEGASAGWAGLMGDLLMSGNGSGRNATDAQLIQRSFTCMTPASTSVWLAGRNLQPYQSGSTSVLALGNANGQIYGSQRLLSAVGRIMGQSNGQGATLSTPGNMFVADHQSLVQRAISAYDLIGPSLAPLGVTPWSTNGVTDGAADAMLKYVSPVTGALKFNPLAQQLQMVARLIDTNRRGNLGLTRQFFMVNIGGFDTHNFQNAEHAERMAQINHALAYFDRVLGAMPGGDMRNQVTTFTASEFGRTFTSNGDGTDHGWGGHHFIMGGAVNGAEVYGTFPQYSTANGSGVFSSPDQIQNGVLIPTTSVDQYAYTLGRWMGVSDSALLGSFAGDRTAILPNLRQFNSSTYDLGFLRA